MVTRDPHPAYALVAEAVQLKAELEEALPRLCEDDALEARELLSECERTITTLGAALTIRHLPELPRLPQTPPGGFRYMSPPA